MIESRRADQLKIHSAPVESYFRIFSKPKINMFFHHLLQAAITTTLLFGVSQRNGTVRDDITEELQEQIDYLRKELKELKEQLANDGTTNEKLEEIQNAYDELQLELEKCYKKIDDLSSSLQQEFRQELDGIRNDMDIMYKELADRMKNLEELVQKLIIDQTIGAIRDGNPNLAAQTYKNIEKPKFYLPRVVEESYGANAKTCVNIIEFLDAMESDYLTSYGLQHTYDKLYPDLFSSDGSTCAYKLAWLTQNLYKTTLESKAKEILEVLGYKFPLALKVFSKGIPFQMRKDEKGCLFSDVFEELMYMQTHVTAGSEFTVWFAVPLESSMGELYELMEAGSGMTLQPGSQEVPSSLGLFRGSRKAYWKPIIVGNNQVALQYDSKNAFIVPQYMTTHCYAYFMDRKQKSWHIREVMVTNFQSDNANLIINQY